MVTGRSKSFSASATSAEPLDGYCAPQNTASIWRCGSSMPASAYASYAASTIMSWGSLSQFSPNLQQPMPTIATLSRIAWWFIAAGSYGGGVVHASSRRPGRVQCADMPRLRIGLAGAGLIGATHSAALREIAGAWGDRLELAAVADPQRERRERFVEAFGWRRATADPADVLGDAGAALVCPPTRFPARLPRARRRRGGRAPVLREADRHVARRGGRDGRRRATRRRSCAGGARPALLARLHRHARAAAGCRPSPGGLVPGRSVLPDPRPARHGLAQGPGAVRRRDADRARRPRRRSAHLDVRPARPRPRRRAQPCGASRHRGLRRRRSRVHHRRARAAAERLARHGGQAVQPPAGGLLPPRLRRQRARHVRRGGMAARRPPHGAPGRGRGRPPLHGHARAARRHLRALARAALLHAGPGLRRGPARGSSARARPGRRGRGAARGGGDLPCGTERRRGRRVGPRRPRRLTGVGLHVDSARMAADGTVTRLTEARVRRLERRVAAVETAVKDTHLRLEQAIDLLTRLVRVVAVLNDRMKRNLGKLDTRQDRVTQSILAGRTADTKRLTALARRLDTLERILS